MESYTFFERLKTHQSSVTGVKISVTGEQWAELTLHERIKLDAVQLIEAAEAVRKLPNGGQLGVEVAALHFERGQQFLDWINDTRGEFKSTEVHQ